MENWKISKQMDIALKLTWKHPPNFSKFPSMIMKA